MSSWLNYVVLGAGVAVALFVVIKEYLTQEEQQQQAQQNNQNYVSANNYRPNNSASTNRRSSSRRKCRVCDIEFAGDEEFCIFLPCLHNQTCLDCGARLQRCITCKRPIADRVTEDGRHVEYIPQLDEDDSTCSICCENIKRQKLNCGHYLCNLCIQKVRECPFCRSQITSSTSVTI